MHVSEFPVTTEFQRLLAPLEQEVSVDALPVESTVRPRLELLRRFPAS